MRMAPCWTACLLLVLRRLSSLHRQTLLLQMQSRSTRHDPDAAQKQGCTMLCRCLEPRGTNHSRDSLRYSHSTWAAHLDVDAERRQAEKTRLSKTEDAWRQ